MKTRTVEFYWDGNQRTPHIRLNGKWLERFGFTVGSRFIVERQYGQILIKAAEQ